MSEDCPHCLYDKTHENCPGCWGGSHYRPKPSAPRRIHSPVDHYDVDVTTGTVSYHVVRTNGDRIRAMCDEDLALFLETATEHGLVSEAEWMTWLKGKAQI